MSPGRISSGGWRAWVRRVLPATAVLLLGAAPARQQDQGAEILIAVLRDARERLPRGSVALDPGPLCTARLVDWSCPEPVHAALAELGIGLSSRAFSHVCPSGPRSCRLIGTDVLVSLSEPEITGSEATVLMDVWWRAGQRDFPVQHARTRYALKRNRAGWEVTGRDARVGR